MLQRFPILFVVLGTFAPLPLAPALAAAEPARTSPLPLATPAETGFAAERLARAGAFLERLQAEEKIAGAVSVVARRGRLVQFEAHGLADIESRRPMQPDEIFAIASMTKPVVTVAILLLVEEGRLRLTDPVERHLPEFRERKVTVAQADAPDAPTLVPAERSITMRDLLTHTAGLPGLLRASQREAWNALPADAVLADWVSALAKLPLVHQPGAKWEYGPATDVAARVVEVVSGQSLDVFLRERIFEPLGMVDTGYVVPLEKRGRTARMHRSGGEGGLTAVPPSEEKRPRLFLGTSGLFSTAADYVRFCQMLLNGGVLDGHRLLSRKTVELMTARHVASIPVPFLPGHDFGLGVALQRDDGASGLLGSPGTYGWSGAFNTYFRIDPQEEVVLLVMVQQVPGILTELHYGFQNTVMQAIVD